MVERKYRKWGSMKNAKEMKIQVEDATLLYLEHRSYIGRQTQVRLARSSRCWSGALQTKSQPEAKTKEFPHEDSSDCLDDPVLSFGGRSLLHDLEV